MPSFILIAVICVSLLALYMSLLGRLGGRLDRYVRYCLGYLALHAAHAWVIRMYFPDNMRLDYYAPYGLLYGPFLYFAYQIANGKPLRRQRVLIHVLPFLVFLTSYMLWIGCPALFAGRQYVLGFALYGTMSASFLSYAVWALFFKSVDAGRNEEVRMISTMAMVLAFLAVVFVVFTYSGLLSGNGRSQFKGSIIFLTMLGAAIILFSHVARRIIGHATEADQVRPMAKAKTNDESLTDGSIDQVPVNARYQKSAVSLKLLAEYEVALKKLVVEKKVYLDDGLSLASLAHQLKIPKHHLSQVFSLRIEKSFNTYINELRIHHAIALMNAHPEWTISEIFLASGFTAKASFNRYFKQVQGCTPTEYRSRIKT
ncbi:helix-turn-helix domain-containing protein [Parapedobacter sp. GCM10030251]|uniref:helix-turn-helix domain-containing protein n=1 Tax=Parapedobacter sp. GCM10030251 TaxID=3273419 RepID=UPI00360736ED